jgi:hypothetical protein
MAPGGAGLMARKRSRVVQARRAAFKTSVLLGDVRAVQRGRVPQRIVNRVLGRLIGRALRGVWR